MRDLRFNDIYEVIESWEALRRIPNYKEATGCIVYQHLFESCPQIKVLFGFSNDIDVNSDAVWKSKLFLMHAKHTTEMIEKFLDMMGPDIELLTGVLQDLEERYAKYEVTTDMYPILGEALIFALEKQLGKRFTPRLKKVWRDVYSELIHEMIHHGRVM